MAQLYFRFSTMNAGKSIEVVKIAYNYEERGKHVLIFTSSLDDRYGMGKIASRMGFTRDAIALGKESDIVSIISDKLSSGEKIDCILVDEAQFLSKGQVDQLTVIVDIYDIPVIAYGLRTDFRVELFEGSKRLFEVADKIEEVKTICWCGRKALINARVKDGRIINEGEQILVGGNDTYVTLCRKHYRQEDLGL